MCVALKIYSARFPQTSVYTQNQSFPPCHTVTRAVLAVKPQESLFTYTQSVP